MCLNFNTVLILTFILRHFITMLRRLGLSKVLPLDHNISLHKLTGKIILFFSLAHTLGHLLNFCEKKIEENYLFFNKFFTFQL